MHTSAIVVLEYRYCTRVQYLVRSAIIIQRFKNYICAPLGADLIFYFLPTRAASSVPPRPCLATAVPLAPILSHPPRVLRSFTPCSFCAFAHPTRASRRYPEGGIFLLDFAPSFGILMCIKKGEQGYGEGRA